MRVAIVHDYLTQYGGAERVVEALSEMFPEAPIFTLFYDVVKTHGRFEGKKIIQSFWSKIPIAGELIRGHNQLFFWLLPPAVERFYLRGYDLVISSSAAFAKGVIAAPGALHICYCHTPTRYLWNNLDDYVTGFYANSFVKLVGNVFLAAVRKWDASAAKRPHIYIANSNHTAARIKSIYRREPSSIIHPPVDVNYWKREAGEVAIKDRNYFLMVGRLLPYKRFDIGIEAARRLGIALKIVGDGKEMTRLKKIAGKSVEFLGWLPDKDLAYVYAHAAAFLMPQVEDFGIAAVEALACGTPVIAYRNGGALDIVRENENGLFFDSQTPSALADAIERFRCVSFSPHSVALSAERFSKERFMREFRKFIAELPI